MRLTWDDWRTEATSWTVYYTDSDDTMYTSQTNTKQLVLTGLQSGRYYRYYIENNVSPCTRNDYFYFTPQHDSLELIMDPQDWHSDTLRSGECYRLLSPSGGDDGLQVQADGV